MNITLRADATGVSYIKLEAEGPEAHKIFELLRQVIPSEPNSSVMTERILELRLRTECAKVYVPGDPTRSNKIAAIKIVREITGMGLKEAKDWVESKIQGEHREHLYTSP